MKLLTDGFEDTKNEPWLVLDGYQFDANFHRAVREAGNKLLVVDDYNHLDYYDCDILLNQNIGADQLSYKTSTGTRLLFGAAVRPFAFRICGLEGPKKGTAGKGRKNLGHYGGS